MSNLVSAALPTGLAGAAGVADSTHDKGGRAHDQPPRRPPFATYAASGLPASLMVSIGSQNAPLSLLFKSALTSISEALHEQDDGGAAQSGLLEDTPQSTASRIVAQTGALFEAYQRRHAELEPAPLLARFMATVRGGSRQGFAEARAILAGLGALQGQIAAHIDQTEVLVRQGYAELEAEHQPPAA